MAGRAEGCQSPASSPVSATLGGRYGNTEGLGRGSSEPQAPERSPGIQGRPSARASTLKAKGPRTLLWRDLDKPDYRQERDQITKQLKRFSLLKTMGPSRCSSHPHWDTPLPT